MANQPAIPTIHKGVQFRSRLEARWAACFDLLGWTWAYEPCDFEGWIPDFALTDGHAPVFVEVKPVFSFPEETACEIDRTSCRDEVLILGCKFPNQPIGIDSSDGILVGWLRANPPCWRPDLSRRWTVGLIQIFNDGMAGTPLEDPVQMNRVGLFSDQDGVMRCDQDIIPQSHRLFDLASNRFNVASRPEYWGVYWPPTDGLVRGRNRLSDAWILAGNLTQWKGKQSVTA